MAQTRRYSYDDETSSTQNLWIMVLVVAAMVGSFLFGKYVIGVKIQRNAAEVRNVNPTPVSSSALAPSGAAVTPTTPSRAVSITSGDEEEPLTIAKPEAEAVLDAAITGPAPGAPTTVAGADPTERDRAEAERRRLAAEAALRSAEEARKRAAEEAQRRAAEEAARKKREAEEAARKKREAEEAARKKREAEEAARKKREAARRAAAAETTPAGPPTISPAPDPLAETTARPQPKPAGQPESTTTEPPATDKPASGELYRVRAGSFQDARAAAARQKELEAKGIDSFVRVRRSNGRETYDVQVGAFEDQANAETRLKELKSQGFEADVASD